MDETQLRIARGEGVKLDEGKLPFHLIPKGVIPAFVRVLSKGAIKYGPDNWQRVEHAHERYYSAAHRHLSAWWEDGEMRDPETGELHLAHALCNVAFLLWFDLQEHAS